MTADLPMLALGHANMESGAVHEQKDGRGLLPFRRSFVIGYR